MDMPLLEDQKAIVVFNIDSFRYLANQDCNSYNHASSEESSPSACASICNSTPECVAFVWIDLDIVTSKLFYVFRDNGSGIIYEWNNLGHWFMEITHDLEQ